MKDAMINNNNICPNCGADIGRHYICPYCGTEDFEKSIKVKNKNKEINSLISSINKEQKLIDNAKNNHSPNGCLILGMSVLIIAFTIIIGMLFIFRNGQGINYDVIGFIILAPIVFIIGKTCDSIGSEDTQKEINKHNREINRLTKEIEEIENGIN